MIRCKVFSAFVIAGIVLTFANASAQSITGTKAKAEAGDTLAQHALGEMYESGQGVPRDSAEAAKWYRKAANQGHARAQYYLGVMHTQGRGVSRDDGEAVKLFRMAAEQGYGPAQGHLGRMFHLGKGVSQNFVLAHKWYNLGASRLTGKLRDSAINLRKSVAKNMTREQLAEARRLAREWMEQHPNATNFRGSDS